MKEHFLTLLGYNHYANNLLLPKILEELPEKEEAVKLMSHILNAQQIWLMRLQNQDSSAIAVWASREAGSLREDAETVNDNWNQYLAGVKEQDMDRVLNYKNSKGDPYSSMVKDIIFHVFNHSTHHRAQISRMLREQGVVPPATDFIFYKRDTYIKSNKYLNITYIS